MQICYTEQSPVSSLMPDNRLTVFQMLKYVVRINERRLREGLPEELTKIIALLAAMSEQERALDCIKLLVSYVVQGTDRVDAETLQVAITQGLSKRGNELMPTLAEQWASQGRAKGLEKDLEKGRQEGTYIGTIQTCRSIVGEPGDSADLSGKSVEELRELAEQLQARLRERLSRG